MEKIVSELELAREAEDAAHQAILVQLGVIAAAEAELQRLRKLHNDAIRRTARAEMAAG